MSDWTTIEGGPDGDIQHKQTIRLSLDGRDPWCVRVAWLGPVLHDVLGIVTLNRNQAERLRDALNLYLDEKTPR